MSKDFQRSKGRIGSILGPALACAVLAALLVGCSPKDNMTPPPGTGNEEQPSSASAEQAISAAFALPGDTSMPPPDSGNPQPTDGQPSADVPGSMQKYTDGTFSATGVYTSPAGGEEVNVSLTLQKDIITDATFQGAATFGKSQKFQGLFAEGYKELVVGKSIDSLSLGVVNGSSLTPGGFMDAVEKIKTEASASAV